MAPSTYPTSPTAYTNPGPTDGTATEIGTRTHDEFHADNNDDLEQLMAKLGTGASTASANTVLRGTGAGATAFGQVVAGDIASDAVTTAKILDANVTTAKLAANAVSQASTVFLGARSTTSTTAVTITGSTLSFTTTGKPVFYGVDMIRLATTVDAIVGVQIFDGAALVGQVLNEDTYAANDVTRTYVGLFVPNPSSGAHTYTLKWSTTAGTLSITDGEFWMLELKA